VPPDRKAEILIVESDYSFGRLLVRSLQTKNRRCVHVSSERKAIDAFDRMYFDSVILNWYTPRGDSSSLLSYIKKEFPATFVLVIAAHHRAKEPSREAGANDFIQVRPDEIDNLVLTIEKALGRRRQEVSQNPLRTPSLDRLIGRSQVMRDLRDTIVKVAKSDSPVLVIGESGSGKRLVALAIHECSPRASEEFVDVSCPDLSVSLAESELFGHVKGAFTGAEKDRTGLLELAHGGTACLDEIADLPLSLQAKLLRFLDVGTVRRLGSSQDTKIDARLIASTNKDLSAEVREARFREDLFYRLNYLSIRVPPLRERAEDLPLLIDAFLSRRGFSLSDVSKESLERLKSYSFPGNVRELDAIVEHAVTLCSGKTIVLDHHSIANAASPTAGSSQGLFNQDFRAARKEFEKEYLRHWLAKTQNHTECAKRIDLSRSELLRKIKEYDLRQD